MASYSDARLPYPRYHSDDDSPLPHYPSGFGPLNGLSYPELDTFDVTDLSWPEIGSFAEYTHPGAPLTQPSVLSPLEPASRDGAASLSSFGYLFPTEQPPSNPILDIPPDASATPIFSPAFSADPFFAHYPTPPWFRLRHATEQAPAAAPMPTTSASDGRKRSHRQLHDDERINHKRPRHSGSSAQAGVLEEIDLASDGESGEAILKKEREELVTSQKPDDDSGPTRFADMTCIICMDTFTDLTATPCGHIFCHECLTQALMAGERSERGTGSCPVCRKTLKRTTKNHVIPLALMTKTKYKHSMDRIGL